MTAIEKIIVNEVLLIGKTDACIANFKFCNSLA